jgi:hypothetical protein
MFIEILSPPFLVFLLSQIDLAYYSKAQVGSRGPFFRSLQICSSASEQICKPWNTNFTYASFLAELRIAFTVVPQTTHWPFKAGLPFFMVTRWASFNSVFFLHLTQ